MKLPHGGGEELAVESAVVDAALAEERHHERAALPPVGMVHVRPAERFGRLRGEPVQELAGDGGGEAGGGRQGEQTVAARGEAVDGEDGNGLRETLRVDRRLHRHAQRRQTQRTQQKARR